MPPKNNTAEVVERAPITETGVSLLALIAASEAGYLMLTKNEGAAIVNDGFAVVDTSLVEGDTAAVRLTEAGTAELAKGNAPETAPAAAPKAKTVIEIDNDVPLPTGIVRRSRESIYPFDKLEIGGSFHVAKTADNDDPASKLGSSVSGANAKFSEVIEGEFEDYTAKTYKKTDDGKDFVKDADGKRVVASEEKKQRPKTRQTRLFVCKTVDASDPKGEGARVWRVALDA